MADCLSEGRQLDHSAVKTGRSSDVDIHPNFLNTHGAQGLLVHLVQNISAHKGERCFSLNTLNVSHAPDPPKGALHVTFVRSQHIDELNELNTCKLESQDAPKMTSASADSRINSLGP